MYLFTDLFVYLFNVWVFCLHVCVYTTYVHAVKGQAKGLGPLRTELQMAASHHVGAEIKPRSPGGAASALTAEPSLQPHEP